MTTLTHAEVLTRLRAHILQEYGSQAVAARAWGVDTGQLSRIMNGKELPTKHILDMIDITRSTVVKYVYEEAQ